MKELKYLFGLILFFIISFFFNANSLEKISKNIIWTTYKNNTKIEYFSFIRREYEANTLSQTQKCYSNYLIKNNIDGTVSKSIDGGNTRHKFLKQGIETPKITIYPSLTSNIINVILDKDNNLEYEFKVFDYLGNDLNNFILINHDQKYVDVTKLSPGLYFLTINKDNVKKNTVSFRKQ